MKQIIKVLNPNYTIKLLSINLKIYVYLLLSISLTSKRSIN